VDQTSLHLPSRNSDLRNAARLAEQIRLIVTHVIENELWLDRAELITVTDVKVSKDLHNVDVYYSVFGEPGRLEFVKDYFAKHSGVFKNAVAQRVHMRRAPKINLLSDSLNSESAELDAKFAEVQLRDAELRQLREKSSSWPSTQVEET
jgi:ribosome-binding factor A